MASSTYRVKPLFVSNAAINVETNMYRMRNLHEAYSDPDSRKLVCNGADEDDYVKFLEGRQLELLKRLEKLRQLLSEPIIIPCPKKIPSTDHCGKMTVQAVDLAKFGLTQEVVLNVAPSHPPYSLLGLVKLWNGVLKVRVTCHCHSTVRTLPRAASLLQDKLAVFSSEKAPIHLHVRLVWKNVDGDANFVVSPLKNVPISGEVNFLRFLNLLVSSKLSSIEQTILDDKLDSCHAVSVAAVSKLVLQRHYQNILSPLNTSKWLSGNEPSVLDLAAWSIFQRQSLSLLADGNAKMWFQNCSKIFVR